MEVVVVCVVEAVVVEVDVGVGLDVSEHKSEGIISGFHEREA